MLKVDEESGASEEIAVDEAMNERLKALDIEVRAINQRGGGRVKCRVDRPGGAIRPVVTFPDGNKHRDVFYAHASQLQELLTINFEEYKFIDGYHALWCAREKTVEAMFHNLNEYDATFPANSRLYKQIFELGSSYTTEKLNQCMLVLQNDSGDAKPRVEISPASKESRLLSSFGTIGGVPPLTLKILGVKVNTHDAVRQYLIKTATSIFFQIDLVKGLPLQLTPHRQFRSHLENPAEVDLTQLQYLKSQYDEQPMTLYWYARSADDNLLQQFLAYYQVAEFYFTYFTELEATQTARRLINHPTFNAHNDADLRRLVNSVRPSNRSGFEKEEVQLRTVVSNAVDEEELRRFMIADKDRREFYANKEKWQTISGKQIVISKEIEHFSQQVAARIYDIRCKIVHSKEGGANGEGEMLMPFSAEAENLEHDASLMQYIAQQILYARSKPFAE